MKTMIVLACLALASGAVASGWVGPPANIALSQDGRNILETPEVAQARAAHIAALQQAAHNNPNPQDDGSYDPRWDNEEYWQHNEQPKWNGAPANQWNAAPAHQWNAAPAAPTWNAAGPAPAPVAETPEVAQARAQHLAALSAANSAPSHNQWNAPASSWNGNQDWNAPAHNEWNAPAHNDWNAPAHNDWNAPAAHNDWNAPSKWNGAPSWQAHSAHPPAQVRLAHDGSGILNTPEVEAARAAHLAAHAKAAHSAPAHPPQQHW